MNQRTLRHAFLVTLALGGALTAGLARSDSPQPGMGAATVYRGIDANQIEHLTPPSRILAIANSRLALTAAPTALWQALEHGEKVECVECIPSVGKLLYDSNAKAREISAWWLRRRIFGVFGPGELYSQTIQTLATDADESRRAYAAEALGEFLEGAGVQHVAKALVTDSASVVRAASARALGRLNSQGPNRELGQAFADADDSVRLEALNAATHINVFSDVSRIAQLISDSSAPVRRKAAAALGAMHSRDAVAGLIALTSAATEQDAETRASAVFSLGQIGDPSARSALTAALSDPDTFVRDAAAIGLRRLPPSP